MILQPWCNLQHIWFGRHRADSTVYRLEYKTNVIKADVHPNSGIWIYCIYMPDGTHRIRAVTSKEKGQDEVDKILLEMGCKFLDDDKLRVLL